MDNESLSLQNFSSVFELFAGYYLLLGTNKKFHDYFNIGRVFKTWTSNYNEIEDMTSNAGRIESELLKTISKDQQPENNVKSHRNWLRKRKRQVNDVEKRMKDAVRLSAKGKILKNQVELHFGADENQNTEKEKGFYKFIKPFYIFFGCLSLVILAFAGFYNEWHRIHTLNIFNGLAIVIILILFIQVSVNAFLQTPLFTANPIVIFILSIFSLVIIALIPCRMYVQYMKLPYDIDPTIISYNDFQVILMVGLILIPIIIHIVALTVVVLKHRRVEKIKSKLSDHLRILETMRIGETIPQAPNN